MVAVLIPAFEPPPTLSALCARLTADPRVAAVLVVDDGSSEGCQSILHAVAEQPRTRVVRHTRNRGKGAALKSGLRYVLDNLAGVTTVVTADADGQHLPEDILRVASTSLASPGSLVLGVREMGEGAPARSRFGNRLTKTLYRGLVGQSLTDTQTGLRAFSRDLLAQVVAVPGDAYEYELNVLISCRQSHVPVVQQPIAAVYLDDNRLSHFKPVRDSLRVYRVLLGFTAVSLSSAIIDNVVFLASISTGASPLASFLGARFVSTVINYQLVRRLVFPQPHAHTDFVARRYVTLVGLNVILGQLLMAGLRGVLGLSIPAAKMLVETLLFLPNFLLQRDVVFRSTPRNTGATDWTSYYTSIPITARLTRRYSNRVLVRTLNDAARVAGPIRRVTELGGANSCFVDRVCQALRPDTYTIVDRNPYGLSLLAGWMPPATSATRLDVCEGDVRALEPGAPSDAVFSIGLIEHFEPAGTRKVIRTHFDLVRSGGVVLVSYPTPTVLYRGTRRVLELLGLWSFPDERPLRFAEIADAVGDRGDLLSRRMMWPLLLTQEMAVFRKR
jgi:glycosyltransferase involved in cell wall biosynthesis